jgi:hypothetical protein
MKYNQMEILSLPHGSGEGIDRKHWTLLIKGIEVQQEIIDTSDSFYAQLWIVIHFCL